MPDHAWPDLTSDERKPTLETLHLWSQIVGKVKLACLPWLNESWHVPLYVSARGLTTGLVTHGELAFEMGFDLLAGRLRIATTAGGIADVPLAPGSVARFLAAVSAALRAVGVEVTISPRPSEIPDAIRFADDTAPRPFDLATARAFWLALVQAQRVFHRFRSRFTGKCSPIHFFWGSFDLAVTRFSGRSAPAVTRGGPNFSLAVARDAYAGEQVSCGFWPGGRGFDEPGFYVEAWPAPDNFAAANVGATGARYVEELGEWVLRYSAVRGSDDPDAMLLAFFQAGYESVADADGWDRARLERPEGLIGRPPVEARNR